MLKTLQNPYQITDPLTQRRASATVSALVTQTTIWLLFELPADLSLSPFVCQLREAAGVIEAEELLRLSEELRVARVRYTQEGGAR